MNKSEIETAIETLSTNSFRRTKNGKYESYVSDHSKTIYLGTYDTEEEAINVTEQYRVKRLEEEMRQNGDQINGCRLYEGNYAVCPSGNIYNLHGHRMIGAIGRDGYRHAIINKKNKDIHSVIAEVFIPEEPGKDQINHINGIKSDNSLDNLERCTRSENLHHAYSMGLEKPRCGENHPKHKLTLDDVKYIRSHYKKRDKEFGAVALSKQFNIDRTTVGDIVRGKIWRKIDD